jgi:hypothetical protein
MNDTEKDTRDLETKLRQDLGMLEWQIRDLMPIVDALYLPREQVEAAIESCFEYSIAYMEREERRTGEEPVVISVSELKKRLGLTPKDKENT